MPKIFLTFCSRLLATLAALVMPLAARADDNPLTFSAVNVTDMPGNMRGGLARGAAILDRGDLAAAPNGGPPAETALEATYSVAVNTHLTVQPDLQYVISPAASPLARDALLIGCRLTLTR